jgi:autoinducer 2-degrading protein
MVSRFIDFTTANHKESVKENGNLRFDFIQQSEDSTRFMLFEAFESEDAAANHKMTPHYLKWREDVKDLMAEPRKGVRYNIIEPNDPAQW